MRTTQSAQRGRRLFDRRELWLQAPDDYAIVPEVHGKAWKSIGAQCAAANHVVIEQV